MADIAKLVGYESPLEIGQKINEIIERGGGGGLEIADIGIAPLGIDETQNKRRYLNGQIIIQEQFVSFTEKVKKAKELYPILFCTETEWQTTVTMSTFGQCGKFVVDDEEGTIRLPKITGFIQGLTDLASLGNLVEAGLPTHTHTRGTMNITGTFRFHNQGSNTTTAWGAFSTTAGETTQYSGTSANTRALAQIDFNAANNWTGSSSAPDNAIYGKSNTVQPESIRYPYFIQVATGSEDSVDVTREIELNNPHSLGDSKYSPVALNNISWLKSEGQWNSKAVYPDYYDWILVNANNGVADFKLSTDTYDDYSWVVNTANETFRLPLTTIHSDNSIEGLILYFYIGETVQNANLINAGRIEENVASVKADVNAILSGCQNPNYSKAISIGQNYTCPSDGYIILKTVVVPSGGEVVAYINNVSISHFHNVDNVNVRWGGGMFKVSKGDFVAQTWSEALFIPEKGV